MDKVVDVVIPTLGKPHSTMAFSLLRHIPWPIHFHAIVEGESWPEAVNLGLFESKNDVILMDDDIFLRPDTFKPLMDEATFNSADIFGFKLLRMDGKIQHAGGYFTGNCMTHVGYGEEDRGQYDNPRFLAHVTTSLVYIKRNVIDKIGGMAQDMKGMQFEDVDFMFRALKEGFKILYVGGQGAGHIESATKSGMENFSGRMTENWREVLKRHLMDEKFREKVMSFNV